MVRDMPFEVLRQVRGLMVQKTVEVRSCSLLNIVVVFPVVAQRPIPSPGFPSCRTCSGRCPFSPTECGYSCLRRDRYVQCCLCTDRGDSPGAVLGYVDDVPVVVQRHCVNRQSGGHCLKELVGPRRDNLRSPEVDVPLDNMTFTYKYLPMSATHLVLYWKEVYGFLRPARAPDHVDRIVHCVGKQTNVVQLASQ